MHVSSKWKILYLEEAVREGQCWRPQRGSSPELSTRFFVSVCVFVLFFSLLFWSGLIEILSFHNRTAELCYFFPGMDGEKYLLSLSAAA